MSVCWGFLTNVRSCAYWLKHSVLTVTVSTAHQRVTNRMPQNSDWYNLAWSEDTKKIQTLAWNWRMTHSICAWKLERVVYIDASIAKKVQLSSFFFSQWQLHEAIWAFKIKTCHIMLIHNSVVNCSCGMIFENDEVMYVLFSWHYMLISGNCNFNF